MALLAACGGPGQSAPTVDTQATVAVITTGTNATVVSAFGSATAAASQQGTIVAQIGSLQTTVAGQQAAGTAQADGFTATTTAIGVGQQSTAAAQQDQATQSARATLTAPTNTPIATATPSVTATPSATSTPTATATPVPKPITAGTVLYQSDWSNGNGGWATPKGWKIFNGSLVNDGTGGGQSLPAPYQTSRADYAVEADIEIVRIPDYHCADFGLYARANYWAGFNDYSPCRAHIYAGGNDEIAAKAFTPKAERQTYRLEVHGNTVRFLINGGLVLETNDNRYLSAGELGMSCGQTQIIVHSFRVIAL